MKTHKILCVLCLTGLSSSKLFAQLSTSFPSLVYPHSILSTGLGEQGVTSRSAVDAIQYNPANLTYGRDAEVSFFRNPWNLSGLSMPITSLSAAGRLGNGASVGIEYTYWDFGEFPVVTLEDPDGTGEVFHPYERSLAGAYAMSFGDELAIGGQIRYVWEPMYHSKLVDHLLFSAGTSYRPEVFSNRLNIGLSFMNFGTPIEFETRTDTINGRPLTREFSESPPAQIQLGVDGLVIANTSFDISINLGVTKPIDKRDFYAAQSSFTSLFNDWNDFPRDATFHLGLGYLWHPVRLGGGISFLQEMYVGYFSTGPKAGLIYFYTHGLKVGVQAFGVTATAGYAGRWHNNHTSSYLRWEFPWETVQFELSSDLSVFGVKGDEGVEGDPLHRIILTAGYSRGLVVGKMKGVEADGVKASISNDNVWSAEADFYLSESSAILSAIHYSRMTQAFGIVFPTLPPSPSTITIDIPMETFSLESGFRYHPVGSFHPLFVQASLGIIRLNPVYEFTSPRYLYATFDRITIGFVLPILNPEIVLMPRVDLTTMFMGELSNASRLGGYNQFEFGLNVGYSL